jgi:glycosyltransferase involved in cell wall biosynthesis
MKILFCLSHINKSLQWLWFAEELKKRNIEQVYVLIDIGIGQVYLHDDLIKRGIETHLLKHNGKLSYISCIRKAISVIKKEKIDLVHTSLPFGNIIGQSAAILCGIKKRVTTCENVSWAHDYKNRKQLWVDNFTFKKAKRIIATSEIALDYLNKHWTFDKSKLRMICHGLNPEDFEVNEKRVEVQKNILKIDKYKNFIIGVVARYESWKGHEYILKCYKCNYSFFSFF